MSDVPEKGPPRLTDTRHDLAKLLTSARDGSAQERVGARERIWKKVSGPKAPIGWRLTAFAAVAAAVAAVVLVPSTPEQPFGRLTLVSGQVQSERSVPAQVGELLFEGSKLKMAGASRAFARLEHAGILLSGTTRAQLSRSSLSLEAGTAAVAVAVQSGKFHVQADAFGIEVAGSVFQVKVGAERIVELFVHDGEVRVRGPATDVTVHAGESWSSAPGEDRAKMPAEDVATVRGLARKAGKEFPLEVVGPRGADISLDGLAIGRAPLTLLAAAGTHEVVAAIGSNKLSGKAVVDGSGLPFEIHIPPPIQPVKQVLPELAPPAEKVEAPKPAEVKAAATLQKKLAGSLEGDQRDTATYELARLLGRRGKHAEALSLYAGLAAKSGAWAEQSQYEVGRLKLRHLDDAKGSVAAFAEYQQRFPKGALAHEVALSEIEAKLAMGASVQRELDQFLAAFPASERLDDVRFIRATVRRDQGDCDGAEADYATLVKHPRHGDDAFYFLAWCEQFRGHSNEARAQLTAYLQQFPNGRHGAEAKAALAR